MSEQEQAAKERNREELRQLLKKRRKNPICIDSDEYEGVSLSYVNPEYLDESERPAEQHKTLEQNFSPAQPESGGRENGAGHQGKGDACPLLRRAALMRLPWGANLSKSNKVVRRPRRNQVGVWRRNNRMGQHGFAK